MEHDASAVAAVAFVIDPTVHHVAPPTHWTKSPTWSSVSSTVPVPVMAPPVVTSIVPVPVWVSPDGTVNVRVQAPRAQVPSVCPSDKTHEDDSLSSSQTLAAARV